MNKIDELFEFGIINIDKSSGPTSFTVSDFVRKKLKIKKTSHFGTLDPKVTGVLPISLGRACKLAGYFLGEDKTYVGIMRMHSDVSIEKIQDKIDENFLGKIKQTPPLKSRVKREEREREIYEFKILEQKEKDFLFEVKCQGGTYIRKLIDDLGIELGVGAHMLELRRIKAGIFDESTLVDLYDFEKAVEEFENGNSKLLEKMIMPAENAIKKLFPIIEIKEGNLKRIYTGKPIMKKDLVKANSEKKDSVVCVFCSDKFIGMYKIINSESIFAKSEYVMQPLKQ